MDMKYGIKKKLKSGSLMRTSYGEQELKIARHTIFLGCFKHRLLRNTRSNFSVLYCQCDGSFQAYDIPDYR